MTTYVAFANKWSGLNYRKDPAVLGPNGAQDAKGVDLTTGVLRNATMVVDSAASTITSVGHFGSTIASCVSGASAATYDIGASWTFHTFGNRAIRIPRSKSKVCCGYKADGGTYFDALGIKGPAAAPTTLSTGAGVLNGVYSYVVTFYNAFGDESPPSPTGTTSSLINKQGAISVIPVGYGTGTIVNTTNTITSVTNIDFFRIGMRITSPTAGIPAGTFITAISGTTITMSQNATASVAGITLQDPQVTGRYLYRKGDGSTQFLRVTAADTSLDDITTTTYTDNSSLDALGAALTSEEYDVLPYCFGGTISPDGVLMAVQYIAGTEEVTPIAFSELPTVDTTGATRLAFLSSSLHRLSVPMDCTAVFYALSRFNIFTGAYIYFVQGTSAADFALEKTSAIAPTREGGYGYGGPMPVEMPDGSVWFASTNGITRFDGTGAEVLTKPILTDAQGGSVGAYTLAAITDGLRYIACVSLDELTSFVLLCWEPAVEGGWTLLSAATYGATTPKGGLVLDFSDRPPALQLYIDGRQYVIDVSAGRGATGVYVTGEWTGKNRTARKYYRGLAIEHNGQIRITFYVDGTALTGHPLTYTRTTMGRTKVNLTSGAQGRSCHIKVELLNAAAEVEVIDSWVDERQAGR